MTLICVKQGSSAAGDIERALEQKPDIITCSWGWSIDNVTKSQLKIDDPSMFHEVIDVETILADAVARGTILCFSAGNGHLSFPACLPQVLAVGGATILADGAMQASNYASSFRSRLYPDRNVPDLCGVVGSKTPGQDNTLPGHIMLPVPPGSTYDGENCPPAPCRCGVRYFFRDVRRCAAGCGRRCADEGRKSQADAGSDPPDAQEHGRGRDDGNVRDGLCSRCRTRLGHQGRSGRRVAGVRSSSRGRDAAPSGSAPAGPGTGPVSRSVDPRIDHVAGLRGEERQPRQRRIGVGDHEGRDLAQERVLRRLAFEGGPEPPEHSTPRRRGAIPPPR